VTIRHARDPRTLPEKITLYGAVTSTATLVLVVSMVTFAWTIGVVP
jgi:hypothetical protein